MTQIPSQTRLKDEVRVIPFWAYALAAVVWVAIQMLIHWGFAQERHPPHPAFQLWFGFYLATVFSPLVLIVGYVNGDSKRRGMNSPLWTALSLVPPNVGILLYFLLRRPLPVDCSRCGRRATPGAAYCSHCGQAIGAVCPGCHHSVEPDGSFCSHCGREQTGR